MSFIDKFEEFLDAGEDYPREPVPKEARRSWWSIGMVWTGVYISVASILEGLSLIGGLPFWKAVLAEVVGFIIFLSLMFIQGNIGTETGLTTYVLARDSFGLKGSYIVALIVFLGDFGWYAIQARTMGATLASIFGFSNIPLLSVISGLTMMITAIFGYRAIAFISNPTVYYTFFTMMFLAISNVVKGSFTFKELISRAPIEKPMTFAAAVSVVVGGMAIGAVGAPDVMRFSRSKKDNVKALFLVVLPFAILQPLASMIVGLCAKSTDIAYVLTNMGGILGLILIIMGTWTSNDNNLYSCSLAISEIYKKGKRWKISILLGILASILSAIVDLSMYEKIMFVIGAFAVPVLGVTITDYYILPKLGLKRALALENKVKLNPAAVIAWIVGGILQALIDFSIIPNPLNIPSSIVTIIVTGVIYTYVMKGIYKSYGKVVQR
ncbi:purine-cytosine permease family protein [Anaerosalibacter bizertensis]|uniref:purine-cytosine permease family protein n=1 Tax=Anaerosalibacter bizertensis TaxID=932217 RepID=UPI001D01D708|nr:cytosine permease [Anaerosalibacter bizertensis]MBV1820314.1 cytosine permease [Bacteroidales bacterium MSK.15.36]MCB5559131.1 cytosine permease [Anaerosalibacter bizertensis]